MTLEQRNDMTTDQETKQKEERQFVDGLFWGGVILWAGLVFWADIAGFLPRMASEPWGWVFLGAGAYGSVLSFTRLASSNLSSPTSWDYIWAGIFVLIGLSGLTSINIAWPLIVVLVGLAILIGALFGRR